MNQLKYLVIHCTDTPEGRPVSKQDIINWHTLPKEKGGRGWSRPGYADMVMLDGNLVNLVPHNDDHRVDPWEITNGAQGINCVSRHIVYVGGKAGKPKDTRTGSQRATLEAYVKGCIAKHPTIRVMGHYQAPNAQGKTCPNFDVPAWLRSIGVKETNIYEKP